MKPTNGTVIADSDMDDTMGYCYDRGDGQYTRLIPVDSLPFALKDIPARVGSDEGLIVLPVPRKAGNGGQPADSQLLPASAVTVCLHISFISGTRMSPLLFKKYSCLNFTYLLCSIGIAILVWRLAPIDLCLCRITVAD